LSRAAPQGPGPGHDRSPSLSLNLSDYRAPAWLPGGHLQTIWAARGARALSAPLPPYRRERWDTPDGDFIDVDFLDAPSAASVAAPGLGPAAEVGSRSAPHAAATHTPWLVLLHGLEGSSQGHYALAFAEVARQHGMAYAVPHFRGCSGELNRAPRAYHSGDFEEVGWMLQSLRQRAGAPLLVVGISLGGNALLRWAAEAGESAAATARAVAAVCSPLDLAAAGHAIDHGLNRWLYARMFLATMKPRALQRLALHPGLFDEARLRAARTLWEFDDVFTAPLHGFAGTADYWARASAQPHLHRIRIPALALNARNDPFIPARSLPQPGQVGKSVTLWQPREGGHVGFPSGPVPGHLEKMPREVLGWLLGADQTPDSWGI